MTTCKDCDEYNPHPTIPGQRRTRCDACGFKSHWIGPARYSAEHDVFVINGGYQADWTDGEYSGNGWASLRDGRRVRLTLCCYAPARADLPRRRNRPTLRAMEGA